MMEWMWESSFFDDNLWLEKGMFTKPRSSVAGCGEKQNFVTESQMVPLLLLLFLVAWTLLLRVACIDRRDSPTIYFAC